MAITKIKVTDDKLKAYMTLIYDGRIPTDGELLSALQSAGIIHGIKYDILRSLALNPTYNESIVVAEATMPKKGENGYVELFKLEEKKEKVKNNEKIDFREFAKNIITVNLGEKIGIIYPPKLGEPGKDVFGQKIPGLPGNPAKVILEKNVEKDEEGNIIATSSGELIIKKDINGTIYISIEEIYEINGDIDFNTGNVRFPGKVLIRGSVRPDFVVEADGDIEIYGEIELAKVFSKKTVKTNGIKGGNKGYIKAKNIIAKFAENAILEAEEKIEIDKSMINCKVISAKEVILDGYNSRIVGGHIKALKKVEAYYLGSPMGVSTEIEVGVDPKLYEEYKNLIEITKKDTVELKAITPQINSLLKKIKQMKVKNEKVLYLKKLIEKATNLKSKVEKNRKRILQLKKMIEESKSSGVVIARKMLYPGVIIRVNNKVLMPENAISKVQVMNVEDKIKLYGYVEGK
ncbi:FapA family protein [Marinitoga hydrogenitolerans]|nr:FapA family protein [Marinitoga hydrogenitolerans]